jgi:hypothetical protein
MSTKDNIADALLKVANLKRTLGIARQVRDGSFNLALSADIVVSLAKQLSDAELEAARLIGPTGYTLDTGGHVSVRRNDRRESPRPKFTYRHSLLAVV